jgi:hypothetical protein
MLVEKCQSVGGHEMTPYGIAEASSVAREGLLAKRMSV